MLNVTLGTWLLSLSELLSGYLIKYLQWIQSLGFQSLQGVHLSAGSLCLLILAVVIFLLPKRLFLWPLSLFCLLPVLFPLAPRLSDGEAFINVLDVGQGSAILIRTREETILYDAGPKWYGGGDAAKSVIIPYFKSQKITRLDKLIISHQDIDHRGGAESLKKEITVLKTIDNKKKSLHSCFEYPAWQSGGVSFHFLRNNRHFLSENNRSCLLMISVANNRFFLTGDIEKSVEKRLVQNVPELSANYLMAPHHGSNSSSLRAFIKAVNPKAVMFSTGYLNRFNFPKEEVLKRYQGMTLLNTAKCGMISFKLSSVYQTPKCYVLNESHFGHYLPL
jgi:competence protein ComEC